MQNNFGRHVLMATQLYGPGRTVFLGFDSTYRWRYLHEEYFDGFWARLIDRVGRSKVLGGRYPFTLSTDKNAYRVGDRVTLRAQFLDAADVAASMTELSGELEVGDRGTVAVSALVPLPHDATTFEATLPANDAGNYTLPVMPGTPVEGETAPRTATLNFRVEPPRQELDDPGQIAHCSTIWPWPVMVGNFLARRGGSVTRGRQDSPGRAGVRIARRDLGCPDLLFIDRVAVDR